MTDVGSHHFIKSKDNATVLVPQPSQDPHDPLVSSSSLLQTLMDYYFSWTNYRGNGMITFQS